MGAGQPQGQTIPDSSRVVPGNSGPAAPGCWETLTPRQPRSRCRFKVGRGPRGGGAAPGAALEPPRAGPESPLEPAAREDAGPRRWGAASPGPKPRRPSRSRSPRGSRAKPRLRAPLGAPRSAPAGEQSCCKSAQPGDPRLPGEGGFGTSAPGAGRRARTGRTAASGSETGKISEQEPEPDVSAFAGRGGWGSGTGARATC